MEVGHQRVTPKIEERTDDPPTGRRDACQSPEPRAFQQTHQDGLGLIVGGVPHGDAIGANPVRVGLECVVASLAGGGLQRAALRHGHASHVHRHTEPRAEGLHVLGVAPGVRTEAVVDVKSGETQ